MPERASFERQEAWRDRRLQCAVGAILIDAASLHVRMSRRLGEAQHWCEASVAALEQRAPMRARLAQEQGAQPCFQRRPGGAIVLRLRVDVRKAELIEQHRVELRLERANGNVLSVGAGVDVVEKRVVERARRVEHSDGAGGKRDAAEARGDIGDRTIDHATLPAAPGCEDGGDYAEGEAEGAASVAENCRRDARRLTVAGGERQDSAQRKIVEVVTRDLRERTVLPPTGHAAIDQSRIALGAFRGSEPKTLHNAWPIALDQRVGRLYQRQRFLELFGTLQIEGDNPFSPPQGTFGQWPVRIAERGLVGAHDRDDLGAEIGEHAAGERAWADPLELDHLQTYKRMHRERPPGRLYTVTRLRREPAYPLKHAPGTAPLAPVATPRLRRAR